MITPLGNKIVIKLDEEETKTASGIILHESAVEKSLKGTVVAVGPGTLNLLNNLVPVTVQVGNKVLLGKFAGQPLELDGEKYTVVKEDEIIGVL